MTNATNPQNMMIDFPELYKLWQNGFISAEEFWKMSKMEKDSFFHAFRDLHERSKAPADKQAEEITDFFGDMKALFMRYRLQYPSPDALEPNEEYKETVNKNTAYHIALRASAFLEWYFRYMMKKGI